MIRRTWCLQGLLLSGVLIALCSGCGGSKPVASGPPQSAPTIEPTKMPGPPPKMPGPPVATPQVSPEAPVVSPIPPAGPQPTETTAPATLPATPPEPPATPTEVVEAKKGVAAQGRSLDQHEGFVVTPIKTFFAVREIADFNIRVPAALNLYKAENDNKVPQTYAEFEEKILKPNKIKLPRLPPNATYEWDPETETLNVRRPVK
jgi:hypothetical protein